MDKKIFKYARDWRRNAVAVKRLLPAFAVLTPMLVFASCSHETFDDHTGKDEVSCTFSFAVKGNSGTTRANMRPSDTVAAPARAIELPCGEDGSPFCLVETVTDLGDDYVDAITRGTPSYTENFRTNYGEVGLYGAAYVPAASGSADTPFEESKDAWCYDYLIGHKTTVWFKPEGELYVHEYSGDVSESDRSHLIWPEGNELWFFLQAPYAFPAPAGDGHDHRMTTSNLTPTYYTDGSIGFSYNEPNVSITDDAHRTYDSASGTITNGAVNQTDFLFTSKRVQATPGKEPECNILMYHCLTGVKFRIGNTDNSRTTIKSITLSGIAGSGDCRLTPNYTDTNVSGSNSAASADDPSKSAQCAVWTIPSGAAKYKYVEEFNMDRDGTTDYTDPEHSNYNVPGFGGDFGDNPKPERWTYNLNEPDATRTLYLVPQATADAKITVTYEVNGVEYTRTSALGLETYPWKAGELHTFTLTVNTLDVDITRSSESAPDVQLTNTGNVTAYLSASLQANWCAEDGKIVYPYTMTGSEIEGMGSNWKQVGDSYYYVHPVNAGNSTAQKLFNSFTPSAAPASGYEGLRVVLEITAQSVRFIEEGEDASAKKADAITLWGTAISDQLDIQPE